MGIKELPEAEVTHYMTLPVIAPSSLRVGLRPLLPGDGFIYGAILRPDLSPMSSNYDDLIKFEEFNLNKREG